MEIIRTGNDLLRVSRSSTRNDDCSFQTSDPALALKVFRKERARAGLVPESYPPACLSPKGEKFF